ncbi:MULTISPECIES: hypothetical protein [Neisseria]|uniref:hypothetical protein n=1 Tax=Neisseria TaxID=482 RepID=UPI0002ED76BF|nr:MULTISPECIES: hypothetical protein [Neisseria]MBS5835502.1 hypothetical protein [Neisseria sp.]
MSIKQYNPLRQAIRSAFRMTTRHIAKRSSENLFPSFQTTSCLSAVCVSII